MVSALGLQVGGRGFESLLGRENVHMISTPSSYLTCPWLSKKVDRCLVTDSGMKCT